MPQPLAVDREAVKAHALTHGVREAARAFNLSEDTVKQWSRRYGWLAAAGVATIAQPLPASIAPRAVPNVPTASAAARYSTEGLQARSRFRLLKAVDKGALTLSRKDGEAILDRAQELSALSSAHAKLCPQQAQENRTLVQIAIAGTAPVCVQPVEHSVGPATTDVAQ